MICFGTGRGGFASSLAFGVVGFAIYGFWAYGLGIWSMDRFGYNVLFSLGFDRTNRSPAVSCHHYHYHHHHGSVFVYLYEYLGAAEHRLAYAR